LLPVRIETRRIGDTLCIRVFPDQPLVNTHQEQLTQEEHDLGLTLSQALRTPPPDSAPQADRDAWNQDVRGQWKEVARRFGTNRAAWILESIDNDSSAGIAASSSEHIPELFVLPDYFTFRVYINDTLEYNCSGRPIGDDLRILPEPHADTEAAPNDGLFDARSLWVKDFGSAVASGLGIAIRLRANHAEQPSLQVSQIVVIGLRRAREGEQPLDRFVSRHHYTGGIEFLSYGTPTNNTGKEASGHSDSDEELLASFDLEALNPYGAIADVAWRDTAAGRLLHALGMDGARLFEHVKGADRVPDPALSLVLEGVWPATGDYFFSELLEGSTASVARAQLEFFASHYVRPRGYFAPLRIGNLPYGVLPATRVKPRSISDATGWAPSGIDHLLAQQHDPPQDPWMAFDFGLRRALDHLLPKWRDQAMRSTAVPRAGGSGDPDDEITRLMGMAPHSLDYHYRPIVDNTMVGLLFTLLKPKLLGSKSGFDGIADLTTASETWTNERTVMSKKTLDLLQTMGATSLTSTSLLARMFSWGSGGVLPMALVRSVSDTSDGPEAYLQTLLANAQNVSALQPDASTTLLYDMLRRSLGYAPTLPAGLTSPVNVVQALSTYQATAGITPEEFQQRLEGALRDVIDALTYRLDAWYSALALRRLEAIRSVNPTGMHWGAYGYVEAITLPRTTATRGMPSVGGGFIHAPSIPQATAAAMLRCAYDSHRDDQPNAFDIDVSSERVRRARTLIEGVQEAQDPAALIGYQFERALHDAGIDSVIDDFRASFPISVPDPSAAEEGDEPVESVPARNVVNGRALVDSYQRGFSDHPEITTVIAGLGANAPKVTPILDELRDTTDAVGDLLMYEGIFSSRSRKLRARWRSTRRLRRTRSASRVEVDRDRERRHQHPPPRVSVASLQCARDCDRESACRRRADPQRLGRRDAWSDDDAGLQRVCHTGRSHSNRHPHRITRDLGAGPSARLFHAPERDW
jgi:hypothetical protein